jgi:hypothetical protein
LALHLRELVVCVVGRALGGVSQGRDHGATSDVEVVGIAIELDGRPEGTTMMKAGVQVPGVCENKGERVETIAFFDVSARRDM